MKLGKVIVAFWCVAMISTTGFVVYKMGLPREAVPEPTRRADVRSPPQPQMSVPVSPQCNVDRRPHRYKTSMPQAKINPGGVCAVALFIEGHCVYFTQNDRDVAGGKICVKDGQTTVFDSAGRTIEMPEDVDRVWSADTAFDGSIGLWQPRYTKPLPIR